MNKYPKEKKKEFLESLSKSLGIIKIAANHVGISRDTPNDWAKSDPKFKEEMDKISEEVKDFVESKLLDLISSGNPTAIIFYAKTKMKDRGYIEQVDHISDHNIQIFIEDKIIKPQVIQVNKNEELP